jgi:ribosomal protein L22
MSSEERQRELREQGGKPGETQKQEAAKEAKEAEAKEKAEEKAAAADARDAEEQPADEGSGRPRRGIRRRKKKEEPAEAEPAAEAAEEEAESAKEEAAEAEVEAEAAEAEGEPEPEEEDATPAADAEEKPSRRRRRGSDAAPATRKSTATPAPRGPDGAVAVRASAKYVRCAPRKARLVVDHIRGRPVEQARALLMNTPRAASRDVLKLLDSAIANAENNHELVADELVVRQAVVDEGPTLKRYRPRALGRATRIRKRTSHMTITLTTTENGRR